MSEPLVHPGQFVKNCPCSPRTVSCGYSNINLHTGCPLDCSYCILQLYLPEKSGRFFTNIDQAEAELKRWAQNNPKLRIGTGELADSLADPRCDSLIPFFSRWLTDIPGMVLELKTKSSRITGLSDIPFLPNLVFGFSLNPQTIIDREESGCASLKDRLSAIKTLAARGFRIAVHFDPLIITRDWPALYRELVDRVFEFVHPRQLAWWSLGALRFPSGLRSHIFRHAGSQLFYGELVRGYDEKYRYLRPLREELFLALRAFIEPGLSSLDPLYLCMEDQAMWEKIFPELPAEPLTINDRLYSRVFT